MTDTKVFINGKPAGEMHQGGFYRFSYDFTDLLKPDKKNLLEVGHVACVGGTSFGSPECIRMSYATSDENIICLLYTSLSDKP